MQNCTVIATSGSFFIQFWFPVFFFLPFLSFLTCSLVVVMFFFGLVFVDDVLLSLFSFVFSLSFSGEFLTIPICLGSNLPSGALLVLFV